MTFFDTVFVCTEMMKVLIYLHGLGSSGQSSTVISLRELLPGWEIISPDIPLHPQEALPMLRQLCKEKKPQLVVGTSMGGMYAQQMHGYCKILVNPAFHVSEFMRKNLGIHTFFSPRQDGVTQFEITPELCDAYAEMENTQFDAMEYNDAGITLGLFGTKDELVDCREEYLKHYSYASMFEGGHRISREVLENVILKWMRAFDYSIGGSTAKLDHIIYTKRCIPNSYHRKLIQRIRSNNHKYGLQGEESCIYDELFLIPRTELYACRIGMKWGILKYNDSDHQPVTFVPCEMDVIFECSEDEASLVPLLKDLRWGFIEAYPGKTYIPPVYEDLDWPCEEPIRVLKDGVWGYLNEKYHFTTNRNEASFYSYMEED